MLVQGLQGPLWLNSVNVVGMLVRFLLMSDVDHRISSETFVYRPNRHILFPLIVDHADNTDLKENLFSFPAFQFNNFAFGTFETD